MKNPHFGSLENMDNGDSFEINEAIENLAFNEQGLLPVITQDAASHKVLMLAWMNKAAITQTLSTKTMTYWSRTRQQLWVKGETSGHTQTLKKMAFDCDGDAILCFVHQQGVACHTGRANCFYLEVDSDKNKMYIAGH